jgi:16S rRNA (cytosine967-C5)-methyltransferase
MSTLWPAEQRLRAIDWAPLDSVRADVVSALTRVLTGAVAARILTDLLRRHPTWTGPERAAAAEALLGVALWRRRLEYEGSAVTSEALLDGLVFGLGAAASRKEPPAHWPTRLSYPDWLGVELSAALGADVEAFAAASNLPGPISVRANRLKTSRDALRTELAVEGVVAQPSAYAPDALILQGRPNILGLKSHQRGLFEVQDEGSQLVGVCVGAAPGDTVLDYCAGSGGKTLLLGAALGDDGRLDAHDIDASALARLEHRAVRAGLRRCLRILRGIPPSLRATHVLVDAPCSALGTLRRGPDVRWRMSLESLDAFPPLQRELLNKAAAHTAPGGCLVYATCTIRRAENQDVVSDFLAANPDFSRESAPVPEALRTAEGDLVTFPHCHGMDAFYAAVLRRSA